MVPHLKTPILKCFYHLLWFYLLTDSEFSCLAMLAKPYPVSGQLLCPKLLTNTILSKRVHMKCLVLSWRPESWQFSHKIIYFLHKPLEL